jgi:hypothetical protein
VADGIISPDKHHVKRCTKCGETKPIDIFAIYGGRPYSWCRECQRRSVREWKQKNPDKVREQQSRKFAKDPIKSRAKNASQFQKHKVKRYVAFKKWNLENPDKVRAYSAGWKDRNREKVAISSSEYRGRSTTRDRARLRHILNKYGMTGEQWNDLYDRQGGVCAICGKPDGHRKRRLVVDHCHTTGRVRGLLCISCNAALGFLGDTLESVKMVLDYLSRGNIIAV